MGKSYKGNNANSHKWGGNRQSSGYNKPKNQGGKRSERSRLVHAGNYQQDAE